MAACNVGCPEIGDPAHIRARASSCRAPNPWGMPWLPRTWQPRPACSRQRLGVGDHSQTSGITLAPRSHDGSSSAKQTVLLPVFQSTAACKNWTHPCGHNKPRHHWLKAYDFWRCHEHARKPQPSSIIDPCSSAGSQLVYTIRHQSRRIVAKKRRRLRGRNCSYAADAARGTYHPASEPNAPRTHSHGPQ